MYPLDGSTSTDLMKKADTAMYWSKEGGKNQANFYTKDQNDAHAEESGEVVQSEGVSQRDLESHIRTALQKNEIEAYLQPVMNLENNSVSSMEALVRWQHPEAGLLQPRKFLNIAENTGMILPIGEFVLTSIAQKAEKWKSLSTEEVKFSMNLSARQLKDESLVKRVVNTFDHIKLPAHWFILEIAENLLLDADDEVIKRIKLLSQKGFLIYIDNLGEGYSSFKQLEDLKISGLKVKKEIVQGAMNSNEDKNVLLSLKALADKIGAEIIAKGVETEDHIKFVKNLGITKVQGFAVAKPNKPEKIESLL